MNTQEFVFKFNQTFLLSSDEVTQKLSQASGWEAKFRQLMLLGKSLPTFPLELQQDEYRVQGCESNVWLLHAWREEKLLLACSSDAKIIKGLIFVLLAALNNKTRQEILDFDLDGYFETLQLMGQLSPSRTNGLHAIVQKIRTFVN